MPADQPDPLEKPLATMLRALPDRAAPGSLEQRVLAELTRRAALPWWRQSYAHWPRPVRTSVLVISAVKAAVFVVLSFEFAHGPGTSFAARVVSRFDTVRGVCTDVADTAQSLIGLIPPLWLYGGLGVLACAYALLLGLGAAAYRLLWKNS